jgi:hypothetical protein
MTNCTANNQERFDAVATWSLHPDPVQGAGAARIEAETGRLMTRI